MCIIWQLNYTIFIRTQATQLSNIYKYYSPFYSIYILLHLYCYFVIMGVTQNRDFEETRFCRVTPAQFIRYIKSFSKAYLDINKPLALYVRIFSAKGTLKFLRITYARTHQEVSHKTKLIGLCLLLKL